MRIKSSAVATGSSKVSVFEQKSYERMRAWDKNSSISMFEEKSGRKKNEQESLRLPKTYLSEKDILELSNAAEENELSEKVADDDQLLEVDYKLTKHEDVMGRLKLAADNLFTKKAAARSENDYSLDFKTSMMQMLVESFSGKKLKITNPFADMQNNQKIHQFDYYAIEAQAFNFTEEMTQIESGDSLIPDWGLDYEYFESTYTKEGIEYVAEGSVTTEDSRQFNFNANLEMVRESMESNSISIKKGAALIDPLVLNLDGETELLGDEKFEFDLDNDGVVEEISTLQRGKAFLALDKNNNGIIDNGSELFGPATNDGFAELKDYDSDGNNWIDENDEIFSQLKLWQRTADGSSLSGLLDHGVGAIYLGSEDTAYDLLSDVPESNVTSVNSDGNDIEEEADEELAGKLRETSFFLREDGSAGLVHEIDFAVEGQNIDIEENVEADSDIDSDTGVDNAVDVSA